MSLKRILVPIEADIKDFSGLQHALWLADRVPSQIFVLKSESTEIKKNNHDWLDKALMDLINTGRRAGLTISYHITCAQFEEEVINFARNERIDLLVIGGDEQNIDRILNKLKDRVSGQVVTVKQKLT
ncbi:MAG: universal stress protein [Deltaproteobacteria bacterium]|nr:universal stress protein [Deltaproteobacteria bacterium]